MDTLLLTSEEPLYLPRYLRPVVEAHGGSIDTVVLAPPRRRLDRQIHEHVRMFGPRNFVRVGTRFAVGTLLDVLPPAAQRRATGRYHGVATLARANDVPVRSAPDVSDPGFVEWVHERDPDLLLSIVCGQRLPRDVLSVPDHSINVHGSLLPRYRGRATAFWPLYYGDDESGVTAHLMTGTFDAGPIIEQHSFPIDSDDSMHDVYLQIAETGASLVNDLLDRYPDGLDTRPNPTAPDDYHTLPTPTQRRKFLRRGNEFF